MVFAFLLCLFLYRLKAFNLKKLAKHVNILKQIIKNYYSHNL